MSLKKPSYKVAHLIRKVLPYTASFIRNQIAYHERYTPSIIFLQKQESPFYTELIKNYDAQWAFNTASISKKLYDKTRIVSPIVEGNIRSMLENINPRVLHLHFGSDAMLYGNVIKKLNIPSVVSFYGYDCTSFPDRFGGMAKILLQKRVFHNTAVKRIMAMSPDMKNDLLHLGCPEEKIAVHYYGSEIDPFDMRPKDDTPQPFHYTIISGLHEKKGHDYLLSAFSIVSKKLGAKVHLNIIGDGPLMQSITAKIDSDRIDNVTLHGKIKYRSAEHLTFLKNADVFVHPSVTAANKDKEGIPGAIVEAMASGTAVISTYHAGIPHIIEDGKTGRLVAEKDVKALANTMIDLFENDHKRKEIAVAGQQYARAVLNIKVREKALESHYDSISE